MVKPARQAFFKIVQPGQTLVRRMPGWQGVLLVLLVVGVASCKNKPVKHSDNNGSVGSGLTLPVADSLAIAHNIDSADYVALFKNKTNAWLYKMLMNKQNRWANFTLIDYWRKDSLTAYAYRPDKGFFTEYAMFLEWSPDSSYILDHGSYGVEMKKDKDGKYYVQSGDVDQEIALINNKAKTTARLLFFGSGTSAWGAHWLDSTQVALLGQYNPETGQQPDTLLWVINVKDRFFRKYRYHSGAVEDGK